MRMPPRRSASAAPRRWHVGDHRPGHIVGQVGRKELDDLRAILDGAEPPQCDQLGWITIALRPGMTVCMIRPVAITPGAMQFANQRADLNACTTFRSISARASTLCRPPAARAITKHDANGIRFSRHPGHSPGVVIFE